MFESKAFGEDLLAERRLLLSSQSKYFDSDNRIKVKHRILLDRESFCFRETDITVVITTTCSGSPQWWKHKDYQFIRACMLNIWTSNSGRCRSTNSKISGNIDVRHRIVIAKNNFKDKLNENSSRYK